MSPSGVAHYDEELKYLVHLLRALPEAIPLGDCHDFIGYIPDPKKIAVAGCTQTVVSHALAASFNRSTGSVVPTIFPLRRDGVDITLPFFRDLLTDKPVDSANKVTNFRIGPARPSILMGEWFDQLRYPETEFVRRSMAVFSLGGDGACTADVLSVYGAAMCGF
ncbi:hypothetical protein C8J57DRAFT_1534991 [Mycena rebaudengoi]|nr:hypothetical protein C8J57DRAFT_1534991 [Mycena rebaudengoi]